MEQNKVFENDRIYIRIEKDKIFIKDKLDQYNEPSAYTKSKRGLEKCKTMVENNWFPCKFKDIINIFDHCNIRYHQYCAVD